MKKLGVLFMIIVALFALSGCDRSPEGYARVDGVFVNENPIAVAIILGRHANAMAVPDSAYAAIAPYLQRAVYGGYVSLIILDGTPTTVDIVPSNFFEETARNTTVLNNTINSRTTQLLDAISDPSISARRSGVDLLAAMREARNVLTSVAVEGIEEKHIIVVSTGISTTGDLDLRTINFAGMHPPVDSIVERLTHAHGVGVLPDLTGINVTFIGANDGMAAVAPMQEARTIDNIFLGNLWRGIVTAAGADSVNFENASGWNVPNIWIDDIATQFPFVPMVAFANEPTINLSDIFGFDPAAGMAPPYLPPPPAIEIRLGTEVLSFIPDEADFYYEEVAIRALEEYANLLETFFYFYPDERIWVVGTTATSTQGGAGNFDLGVRRAERVRDVLVTEFDIPYDRLLTISLGARFPWIVDAFPNGVYDSPTSQPNRAVWLLTDNEDTEKLNALREADRRGELLPESSARLNALSR